MTWNEELAVLAAGMDAKNVYDLIENRRPPAPLLRPARAGESREVAISVACAAAFVAVEQTQPQVFAEAIPVLMRSIENR